MSSGDIHFTHFPLHLEIALLTEEASPWFFCETILILSEYSFKILKELSVEPSSTQIISISV